MTSIAAKISKANDTAEKERFKRAEQLLNLEKERVELDSVMNKDKEWFRTEADGETLTQVVPGLGQVMVKKGSAPQLGGNPVHLFNEQVFTTLPLNERKRLIKIGLVTVGKTAPRAAGTPSVCLTLNK